MNILVTGATGFIGRHLVEKLLEKDRVTVYALSRSPLALPQLNHIPLTLDMSQPNWTEAIPPSIKYIVYLAQSKRYRDFPDGAGDMVGVNIDATWELLDWSRRNGIKKFLFASTGNVYKPSPTLLRETDACEAGSLYAATKLSAEFLLQQYSAFFQTVTMRLFGVYGPGQKDMIIASMVDRVRTGQEISLAQGVGLYLTPLYISDCVAMIEQLLMLETTRHEIFNLAGTEILSLDEIVRLIADRLQQTPKIRQTDDQPRFLQGSNEKICQTINYQPLVSFSEGINRTLQVRP